MELRARPHVVWLSSFNGRRHRCQTRASARCIAYRGGKRARLHFVRWPALMPRRQRRWFRHTRLSRRPPPAPIDSAATVAVVRSRARCCLWGQSASVRPPPPPSVRSPVARRRRANARCHSRRTLLAPRRATLSKLGGSLTFLVVDFFVLRARANCVYGRDLSNFEMAIFCFERHLLSFAFYAYWQQQKSSEMTTAAVLEKWAQAASARARFEFALLLRARAYARGDCE